MGAINEGILVIFRGLFLFGQKRRTIEELIGFSRRNSLCFPEDSGASETETRGTLKVGPLHDQTAAQLQAISMAESCLTFGLSHAPKSTVTFDHPQENYLLETRF
ncbi:hypothetical protein VNO77_02488 [Canavalia gladiata]|uniref:Uncharacterized protein n=1 Tax=Canavalia gladiata TaxID=3824 RepID=A0AAN9MV59_CANGL